MLHWQHRMAYRTGWDDIMAQQSQFTLNKAWMQVEIARKKMEQEQAVEHEKELRRIRDGESAPESTVVSSTPQKFFMRNMDTKEATPYLEYGRKKELTAKVEKFAFVVRGGKVMGSLFDKNSTQVYIPISNWSYRGDVDPCVTSEVEYWDWECSGSGALAIEIHDAFALLSLAGQGGWEEFSTAESKQVFAITRTLPDGNHWFEYNFEYPDGALFLLFGKQLRTCDHCKEYVSIGYHCPMCLGGDFDMCTACYEKHGHDQSHAIHLFGKPLRVCDVCKCHTWAGYHCPVCVGGDFDVCYSCYMKHGHDKSHAIQRFGKLLRTCHICQCQTHTGYHCLVCEGDFCYACYIKCGHDKSHAIRMFGKPLRTCNVCDGFTHAGYYCTTCEGFNVCYACYVNHEHDSSHEMYSF